MCQIGSAAVVAVTLEKHEAACGMLQGIDWSKWHDVTDVTPAEKMALLPPAQEHIIQQRVA